MRVFYMPAGTVWKDAYPHLRPVERVHRTWSLRDDRWRFGGTLRLSVPGAPYSIILLRNADGSLFGYYVNLEEPLRQTEIGFDYEDNTLDVIVAPDLSGWSWRDEDELEELVTAGLVSPEKAAAIYAEGKAAIAALQSRKSVFSGWENWRPDPSWPVPVLPMGWDRV